ncbi:MAG: hypothetical protein EOP68_10245 [Sphingomonas sp.]|nr:MAG: hypothetical protein EOP68_10245 [Sphingomonas sp.]
MWRSLLAPQPLVFAGTAAEAIATIERGSIVDVQPDAAIAIADAARAASIRSVQIWPTGGDCLDALAAGGVAPVLSRPFSRDALLVALGVAATMEALVPEAA